MEVTDKKVCQVSSRVDYDTMQKLNSYTKTTGARVSSVIDLAIRKFFEHLELKETSDGR